MIPFFRFQSSLKNILCFLYPHNVLPFIVLQTLGVFFQPESLQCNILMLVFNKKPTGIQRNRKKYNLKSKRKQSKETKLNDLDDSFSRKNLSHMYIYNKSIKQHKHTFLTLIDVPDQRALLSNSSQEGYPEILCFSHFPSNQNTEAVRSMCENYILTSFHSHKSLHSSGISNQIKYKEVGKYMLVVSRDKLLEHVVNSCYTFQILWLLLLSLNKK